LHHILSGDEIYTILTYNGYTDADVTSWMAMTVQIAESIHTKVSLGNAFFPEYHTPADMQALYDSVQDSLVTE
jgi:hypothetical protein